MPESATVTEIPDTVEALQTLVRRLLGEHAETVRQLQNQLIWAEEKYKALALRYFGRKSEKGKEGSSRQYRLFNEAEVYAPEEGEKGTEKVIIASHERKKGGRRSKAGGSPLPCREEIHGLSGEERRCPCCGKERPEIGEERSSEYDLIPEHVVKIGHIRKKYGPCGCGGSEGPVAVAPGPEKILPGSDYTNRSTAFFITGKYADGIPFYRMEKMLSRHGLEVSRACLSNQAIPVGRAISPLIEGMNRDLAGSPVVLMDETTVEVLNEKREKEAGPPGKSYMWVMRGYREGKPIHRFAYFPSRSGICADSLLKGYQGHYIQTDGYPGYDHLGQGPGVIHVGCFAHIRRKYVEAVKAAGGGGIGKEAIELIGRLYGIEGELREALGSGHIDADTFVVRRKARAGPVIKALEEWQDRHKAAVPPESSLGKAIVYAQKALPRAARYVEHSLLTPDTNGVENAIRPFVAGRKGRLFCGSRRGAHASAGIYSLIETAKANGHEPYRYLCYVFERLPRAKTPEAINALLNALLPYNLSPEHTIPTG